MAKLRMAKLRVGAGVLLALAGLALASCSSSGGSGGTASGGDTITVGVAADLTGAAASGFLTTEKGVKAYFDRINAAGGVNGVKIKYVMADTGSTPTGALAAAQKLYEEDHVFAIMQSSAVFDGVVPYTQKNNIPLIAGNVAGTAWADPQYKNVFVAGGPLNPDYVLLNQGKFMKAQGVTSCGTIGANSPNGVKGAQAFAESCRLAGLKVGYINTQLEQGTTDMGPIALAMKKAGVDGISLAVGPATGFALIASLKRQGVAMKSTLMTTGYGGDLLASPPAVQASQGVDFSTTGAPAEANTPATKQRAADLAKVGVNGPPTYAEQNGYLLASAFVAGLKAAGPNPTPDSFMTAMAGIKDFDEDGLLSPEKIDFRDYTPSMRCLWVAQLTGNAFHVVPGTPVCAGTQKLPG